MNPNIGPPKADPSSAESLPRAASRPALQLLALGPDKVSAGFPSPAADYADSELDINQYLVRNPLATFFFVVQGDSMQGHEIFDGDMLVVDRSINALSGHIVVAFVDGERLVKQLFARDGRVELRAGNPAYKPLVVDESTGCDIWGVVIGKFKRLCP